MFDIVHELLVQYYFYYELEIARMLCTNTDQVE